MIELAKTEKPQRAASSETGLRVSFPFSGAQEERRDLCRLPSSQRQTKFRNEKKWVIYL
jgi:hypothetical protein